MAKSLQLAELSQDRLYEVSTSGHVYGPILLLAQMCVYVIHNFKDCTILEICIILISKYTVFLIKEKQITELSWI